VRSLLKIAERWRWGVPRGWAPRGDSARAARALPTALLLLALVAPSQLSAQQGGSIGDLMPPPPGPAPAVYLLTFTPGSRVYEVWGHNAIWIRDPARGVDLTYNWGVFNFTEEGFIGRLAKGTMLYWMEGVPAEIMIPPYIRDNRTIYVQELNLNLREKSALVDLLVATDTDANRYYLYDYWRDNCSTRVRDALDTVLGGRIRAALEPVPAGVTGRWHARRILSSIPPAYAGMEFALGNPSDEPITEWDEGFLPMELMAHLRKVNVLDESGREVPLVVRELTLFEGTRAPEAAEPPFWLPWFLLGGLLLGGVVVVAARTSGATDDPSRPAGLRLKLAAAFAVAWSLLAGMAGLALGLAWLLTDHWSWFRNENLLQASPVSLALAALLVVGHFARGAGARWVGPTALVVLGLSMLGFLIQPLPGFDQTNGEIIAFALPVHAAVAWLAVQLGRRGPRPRAS
jgi:hypothetical protein